MEKVKNTSFPYTKCKIHFRWTKDLEVKLQNSKTKTKHGVVSQHMGIGKEF